MKILHAIRGLANSSGTTHIVGPLAEAQARLGHEVEVFCVHKFGQEAVFPDRSLVSSREFAMTFRTRHFGYSREFCKTMRQRVADFDVVHIHAIWNYVTYRAMTESQRAGVPYMVAPQGSLETWALNRNRFLKNQYANFFEKKGFNRAACMQALTVAEAAQCRHYGITSPVAVLPNGVDLPKIDQSPGAVDLQEQLNLPDNEFVILFLGRIFPKKGLDILVDAFSSLLTTHPNVTLCIAGHDGGSGYQDFVRDRLVQRDALRKAKFLGEVSGTQKFSLLRAADLFVLPSYSEGLPVAVVEAMAVGTPIVITPGCNLPEIVDSNAGWVVEANPLSLASGLRDAVDNQQTRLQRAASARKLVETRFNWQAISMQSIDIYTQMIAGFAS